MRFVRFNVTGALGVGVQLAALWLLTTVLSIDDLVATVLAVGLAVAHNFLWHWRWTWRDRAIPIAGVPAAFARFAGANGVVSLAGNVWLMFVLVGVAGLPPVGANLVAIAACGLVNYRLGDRFVFRRAVSPAARMAGRTTSR